MVQTSLTAWLKNPAAEESLPPLKPPTLPHNGTRHASEAAPYDQPCPPAPQNDPIKGPETQVTSQEQEPAPRAPLRPFKSTQRPLHPNVELGPITEDTLPSFRRLNSLLLPVPYSEKFYAETVSDSVARRISLAALWHDTSSASASGSTRDPRLVGAIRCRLLAPLPGTAEPPTLYVSTVCVLAPYRRFGIAAALLRRVTARAAREHRVQCVTAHVWEANAEGREWYKRLGFREVRFEDAYYRRLRPSGAWLVERRVSVGDLLGEEREEEDGVGSG